MGRFVFAGFVSCLALCLAAPAVAADDPGTIEQDWLGVDMYFSHFSAKRNRRLVEAAGFVVDSAEILVEPEDRFEARFLWVVAHAP